MWLGEPCGDCPSCMHGEGCGQLAGRARAVTPAWVSPLQHGLAPAPHGGIRWHRGTLACAEAQEASFVQEETDVFGEY